MYGYKNHDIYIYISTENLERRQCTGLILSPIGLPKGGQRRKGGDPE